MEIRYISVLSFAVNFFIIMMMKRFFGVETAVLFGIATVISTIDGFGYGRFKK